MWVREWKPPRIHLKKKQFVGEGIRLHARNREAQTKIIWLKKKKRKFEEEWRRSGKADKRMEKWGTKDA